MAADTPPVDADLSGFEATTTEPPTTEFWRNLWPWEDLNAKSPPEAWQQFHRDVLPVLAALTVIRSPTGPRALSADLSGRLQVAGISAFGDVTTEATPINNGVVTVADGSLYSQGMFLIFPDAGKLGPGVGGDWIAQVFSVGGQNAGGVNASMAVQPSAPSFIPAGTPFLVMAPPSEWVAPAPWKSPTEPILRAARSAAGTTHLAAGVGGQLFWIHSWYFNVIVASAGGQVVLQDTLGNVFAECRTDTVHEFGGDHRGLPLIRGVGIDLVTTTASTVVGAVGVGRGAS